VVAVSVPIVAAVLYFSMQGPRPGERISMEIRDALRLTAGDAAAVGLTLNGAAARPLGGDGQVVSLTLNLANFREYLTPR
jgi:hypothetical protein